MVFGEAVTAPPDDFVAAFGLDKAPVRGRIVRAGPGAIDPILRRHAYPRAVALLLGEALSLAALIGSLLKVDGRLVVQAQGEGPVTLLLAEHRADGGLRGYARLADGAEQKLENAGRLPTASLLGAGALALTLDQGDDMAPHQGVVALEGDTLAECAENYFRDSEQVDTRVKLAVGEAMSGDAPALWRAGGVLMQRIAADDARGDPVEDWSRARILLDSVRDDEMLDPDLGADRLLYRLFHEEGARMSDPAALEDRCTCDAQRLTALLKRFTAEEVRDLIEPDGKLHARCQFCARTYLIAPDVLSA